MSYRCKHCVHGHRCTYGDGKSIMYCNAHERYCQSPLFVEAWGCNEFEDTQLKLFQEERRTKDDNSHHSGTSKRQGNKDH